MSSSQPKSDNSVVMSMEDIVVCQECPKSDVCMVIHSLVAQYQQNKELIEKIKTEFKVEINIQLTASVTECPHRPEMTLL